MAKAKFYCEECNEPVAMDAEFCPHCGKKFEGVRCPVCGHSGREKDFLAGCPVCGYLSVPTPSAQGTPAKPTAVYGSSSSPNGATTENFREIPMPGAGARGLGVSKKEKKKFFFSENIYKMIIAVLFILLALLLFFLFQM